MPTASATRHAELVRLISEHDYRYYVEDSPTIADRDYDRLYAELVKAGGAEPPGGKTPTSLP